MVAGRATPKRDLETRIETLERLIDQERAERHDLGKRLFELDRRIQKLEEAARDRR